MQLVVTGGFPLTTVGPVQVTAIELPVVSWTVCDAGHVIFGGSGVGGGTGVGLVLPPQALAASDAR